MGIFSRFKKDQNKSDVSYFDEVLPEIAEGIEKLDDEAFASLLASMFKLKEVTFQIHQANYKTHLKELKTLSVRLESMPINVKFSTALACNLHCIHCGNENPGFREKGPSFPTGKVLLEFLRISPYLKSANLFREGEPFLWKHLMKLIRLIAIDERITVVSTNGSLLTPQLAEKVVKSGLGRLLFSIDGGTKETIEKIRYGLNYDKLVEGVAAVNRVKKELGTDLPELSWHFVAMRDNIEELPLAMELAADWGFKVFHISYCNTKPRNLSGQDLSDYPELTDRCVAEAVKIGLARGITVHAPLPFGEVDGEGYAERRRNATLLCRRPWREVEIGTDGGILPCCGGQPVIGNLNKNTMAEIWNNEAYRELRRSLASGELDRYCEDCYAIGFRTAYKPQD